MYWIQLVQNMVYWWAIVNAVMKCPVPLKAGNLLTRWVTISLTRRTLFCGVSRLHISRTARDYILKLTLHLVSVNKLSTFTFQGWYMLPSRLQCNDCTSSDVICTATDIRTHELLWGLNSFTMDYSQLYSIIFFLINQSGLIPVDAHCSRANWNANGQFL